MPSAAISAFGSKLGYGATPTYIAEVTNVTPGEISVGEIETTNMDSTANYAEYLAGKKDAGSITVTCNFLKATMSTLMGKIGAVPEDWTVAFSDGSKWVCKGFITKIAPGEATNENKHTYDLSIRLTGQPTYTAGT